MHTCVQAYTPLTETQPQAHVYTCVKVQKPPSQGHTTTMHVVCTCVQADSPLMGTYNHKHVL